MTNEYPANHLPTIEPADADKKQIGTRTNQISVYQIELGATPQNRLEDNKSR